MVRTDWALSPPEDGATTWGMPSQQRGWEGALISLCIVTIVLQVLLTCYCKSNSYIKTTENINKLNLLKESTS